MTPVKVGTAVLLAVVAVVPGATTQRAVAQPTVVAKAVDAANALLSRLDERQRAKVRLPLNATTRTVWSNLPTGTRMQVGATERNGLKFADMTPQQQDAALALVAATLSSGGFHKVTNIVAADQLLEERSAPTRQAGAAVRFGRGEYYVAILGTPSTAERWMMQFGGHHLAINVTIAGGRGVLTPTHTGAQPSTFTLNGQTIRPLGQENDRAFALMNALNDAQQKKALLGFQVRNLVLGPGEDGKTIQPEGVRASELTAAQQTMLVDLAAEWVNILEATAATEKLAEIRRNLADTYFAWAGSTTNGQPAYFRIQGPTVLIEYAPQGNNAASTDHIHTIYRDPTNDYADKAATR